MATVEKSSQPQVTNGERRTDHLARARAKAKPSEGKIQLPKPLHVPGFSLTEMVLRERRGE